MNGEMKRMVKVILGVGATFVLTRLSAAPKGFDEWSAEAQEYVVDCLTNSIRGGTLAFVHWPSDGVQRLEELPMPWFYELELNARSTRTVLCLKGDGLPSDYSTFYLYRPLRVELGTPLIEDDVKANVDESGVRHYWYWNGKNIVRLKGKAVWAFEPPYDPFDMLNNDEFVRFAVLTPQREIDLRVVRPTRNPWGTNTIAHVAGPDLQKLSAGELSRALGVTQIFSNRVFRLNEGCVFQVDWPVPELEWLNDGLESREEHRQVVDSIQKECDYLMHLSLREVSEIVFLAYLAEGPSSKDGYEKARKMHPKALCNITSMETNVGRKLYRAMVSGGMVADVFGMCGK